MSGVRAHLHRAALCARAGLWALLVLATGCDSGPGPVELPSGTFRALDAGVISTAPQLALGWGYSCFVSRGVAKCWGENVAAGVLGDGTTAIRTQPIPVVGLAPAAVISPRESFMCALLENGAVNCWGDGSGGSLGDGMTTNSFTPVAVVGIPAAIGLATGPFGSQSCALLVNSQVACWGSGSSGQVLDGLEHPYQDAVPQPVLAPTLTGATKVVVGEQHTCGLLPDGSVRCGGANEFGQVGDGTTAFRTSAVAVIGLGQPAIDIAAGFYYTCAVLRDGTARCWGNDSDSQLGDGRLDPPDDGGVLGPQLSPTPVLGLAHAVKIAAGMMHTCALLADGTVSCWGNNVYGQVGDGRSNERVGPTPVVGLSGVTQISVGEDHTCALLADQSVECWGANAFGQLGDGTTDFRMMPTPVQF